MTLRQDSQTHKLIGIFRERLKPCFRYSFLGRITEIRKTPPSVLKNSLTVAYLINFYAKSKEKIYVYIKNSLSIELAKDTKKELYFSPVRIISLTIVTTIFINEALSIILQKGIDLWSFLLEVLFLFAGTAGLSCAAGWPAVKESSIFLRKLR